MKRFLLFCLPLLLTAPVLGQAPELDTLSNLPEGTALYAPRYTESGQWGYLLGQNSSYRQQFAEKYEITESTLVRGVMVHLTGTFAHPDHYVEFNVYTVGVNGLPAARLGGKQVFYKDLDLSGEAAVIDFSTPIAVQEAFFVTFNVFDYLHGGYEGDTLGLLMGEPGSRTEADLTHFGRNAVQAHNHTKEDWKDFYSQNFTPIATHFALFPIVDASPVTALEQADAMANGFSLYPNPSDGQVSLVNPGGIPLHVIILNGLGQRVFSTRTLGQPVETLSLTTLPAGYYQVLIQRGKRPPTAHRIALF
ncbi:Por secretion system C-terminal sorting domain-containing protein [Catalinimonas alkaloidigena]|uniref:Por secretion system C-terminal sorting domain-containing protein n=1 Tax=Catalinimonas alkaloidigena TaxID=1075417 RepID=A0A1G9VEQ1_9BACT|nr:T9SS type A sorting domain-containing protein [Catalinimonas alkaloidigena]SDM70586.1 Por secretion system C-terminal sorting domain-containing protein [Catalinimonas alkaloidigena]